MRVDQKPIPLKTITRKLIYLRLVSDQNHLRERVKLLTG